MTLESLAKLKPVFPDWGNSTTTAGNASGVGDGAAICILTTRSNAEQKGMEVLGKFVASTFVGVEPKYMGISPAFAIPKILKQTGLKKEDVDVYEVRCPRSSAPAEQTIQYSLKINEAFASQFAYCVQELAIPMAKINPK